MDKVLRVSERDGDATVQCGVKWEDLNDYLDKQNVPLFFPLDPGPGATIGGMIGTGCSGTNAVRYGTAKGEWFLNLVRSSLSWTPRRMLRLPLDCRPAYWGGDQDPAKSSKVVGWMGYYQALHWRGGDIGHRHRSNHQTYAENAHKMRRRQFRWR